MSHQPTDKHGNSLKQRILRDAGIVCAASIATVSSLLIANIASQELVISAIVNDTPIGYVNSLNQVEYAYNKLQSTVHNASQGTYPLSFDIDYQYEYSSSPVYLTEDQCYNALWSQVEKDFCDAYVLYVDDRFAAVHESKEALNALIASIESELLESLPAEFSDVRISNRIRIEPQLCSKQSLKTLDEINNMLNPLVTATLPAQTDELVQVRVSALEASSPSTRSISDISLDYNFLSTVTVTETIPYETNYLDDPDNYIGTETLISEGDDGAKVVTYQLIYDAEGNFIGKSAIEQVVIKEASTKVVLVGTAELPDTTPTGTIIWPCDRPKGVSSYYGWRDLYGKPDFHLGIDIPNVKGSAIWASDGGMVLFAGFTPSYGYNVHIEHTAGVSTLYAHLNTISVKAGDKVFIGQQIGTMGATGVAYGTHLHYEVRIDNKTVDPINYLPAN